MTSEKTARLAAIRAKNQVKTERSGGAGAPPASADPFAELPPAMPPQTLVLMLIAMSAGVFAAVVVLPTWLPGLTNSLLGPEPKAYWYLSRSSAFVAYLLLWLSMVFGLLMTSKMARIWPGGPVAFDLHQHTSLLGLILALIHGLILLGDRYIQADLWQILVPFGYSGYQIWWVALGQIGLYLLAVVGLSFYLKSRIGYRSWRVLHFASFVLFVLALLHAIGSGSDSDQQWVQLLYLISGGSVLFLTIYRILMSKNITKKLDQRGSA
jgi:predicted ferric reductase